MLKFENEIEKLREEGLKPEEKERIKQDEKFMRGIISLAEKYGGSMDISIQFKDLETNEVVFNIYAQVNEEEIIKITPMPPEEVPSKDVTVEINFEEVYELIESQEKEMDGNRIESPPWDRKAQPTQKIKEVVNGIQMYFKIRSIMNSAKITPEESEKDVKNLFKSFISMMMRGERNGEKGGEDKMENGEEADFDKMLEESNGEISDSQGSEFPEARVIRS